MSLYADVEKIFPGRFGAGIYRSRFWAGADQALCAIVAFGRTHCKGVLQPAV
jgi:hypothetical protein